MGYWLIAAIALQLACALCAAKLDRPAVWLQFILLVPVLGALAFCVAEVARAIAAANPQRASAPGPGAAWPDVALGGIGYRAVCARTAESRRALAEECLMIGRHADARLLLESCGDGADAQEPDVLGPPNSAPTGTDRAARHAGGAD